jgi:hypothetical protein
MNFLQVLHVRKCRYGVHLLFHASWQVTTPETSLGLDNDTIQARSPSLYLIRPRSTQSIPGEQDMLIFYL